MFNKQEGAKSRYINLGAVALVLLVLVAVAYFFLGMRKLGEGPKIFIDTPPEGVVVNTPIVEIEGKVENVSGISINGEPVVVRDNNLVKEQLILQPGENEFEFKAKDQFGNETVKTLKIIYKEK